MLLRGHKSCRPVGFCSVTSCFYLLSGLKHLREFAALEIDNLKHELEEKNYVRLKQAILALDLEIWLEDHDLKAMYSILAKEGYTTRKDLYKITLEEAKQVYNYN